MKPALQELLHIGQDILDLIKEGNPNGEELQTSVALRAQVLQGLNFSHISLAQAQSIQSQNSAITNEGLKLQSKLMKARAAGLSVRKPSSNPRFYGRFLDTRS